MNDNDLNIQFTRGSGNGGQHRNKVETCVVITHIPTKLSIRCQDTRSKIQNLKIAKERLNEKIEKFYKNIELKEKQKRRIKLIQNAKIIRTYNFNRNEVYDHRSKIKANLKQVMNGNLDLL